MKYAISLGSWLIGISHHNAPGSGGNRCSVFGWRQQVPPKRWHQPVKLRSAATLKTGSKIYTAIFISAKLHKHVKIILPVMCKWRSSSRLCICTSRPICSIRERRTVAVVSCAYYTHLSFKPQLPYTGFLYEVIQKIPFFQYITNSISYQQAEGCNCRTTETEKTFEVRYKGKIWFQIRDD
jgi:hypothetical protein